MNQFTQFRCCWLALPFVAASVVTFAQAKPGVGMTTAISGALADVHLVAPVADGQWTMPAGDYGNTRYSPLDQINSGNAGNLHVVGKVSTGIFHGYEGSPLVVGSTLYIVTPFPNDLIAIDLTKPGFPVKWRFHPNPEIDAMGKACCDVVNRGASFADGKIIYNTLDAHTLAVDANTGKQVWKTQVGDLQNGETLTMAPVVVNNIVFVGNSGGDFGVRGALTALDARTGKILWKAYSTGPDSDVRIGPDFKPFYAKDQGKNLGVSTWTPDQWQRGGGTVWGWISYDPELNLIYYGTGNAGVWNSDSRPGDNKWSVTIWARNPETGMAKWAYQIEPHDSYNYDEVMENILVDMPWQGRMRKLLIHPGRTGFVFVMDRETGELLSASEFEPVTWAAGYNLKNGEPIRNPDMVPHYGQYTEHICPSATGAKEIVPSAFSPKTGYLYIPAHNTCMDFEDTTANYIAGTPYVGANVRMYPGPGGYQGEFIAWDVAHARKVWSIKEPYFPVYSGVLATGGDLAFYGTMDGYFRAVDDRTGKVLWQFKTPSGIVGNPMTFTGPNGKQYVAIYSGIGGWMGSVDFPDVSSSDPYAARGAVGAMRDIKSATHPGDFLYVFSE
ncbi:MAG TPA: PQQ-dependent dehydrogenase, methanol/ethanol family [Terracidiphilus sp.]|nr:PQQ-dependent dehydrogenase, methanol/ethanol family [Terracidiphilus sp.]